MQVSTLVVVLLIAFGTVAQAVTYSRIAGYYEGTSIDLYNFGTATAASTTGANAWQTVYILPDTITTGPDGGSRGEVQALLCSGTNCPEVLTSGSSSLYRKYQAIISNINNNASFTSVSTFDTTKNYSTSTGWNYRRIVANSDDILQTTAAGGITPFTAYYNGALRYYFDFGGDTYPSTNAVYIIQGGAAILKNTNTHFVQVFNIVPPSGATESPVRFSEIPADWLSNSNITSTNGQTYEFGFTRVAATPPPVAAANTVVPSLLVALIAVLAAFIF